MMWNEKNLHRAAVYILVPFIIALWVFFIIPEAFRREAHREAVESAFIMCNYQGNADACEAKHAYQLEGRGR